MTDPKPPGLDWTRFEDAVPEDGAVIEVRHLGPCDVVRWSPGSVMLDRRNPAPGPAWRYPPVPAVQREAIERDVMGRVALWVRARAHELAARNPSHTGTAVAACLEVVAASAEDGSMLRDFHGLPVPGEGVGDG